MMGTRDMEVAAHPTTAVRDARGVASLRKKRKLFQSLINFVAPRFTWGRLVSSIKTSNTFIKY